MLCTLVSYRRLFAVVAVGIVSAQGLVFAQSVGSTVAVKIQVDSGRSQWGLFSPTAPHSILLAIDGRGFLATLPDGEVRAINEGYLPVGWLGSDIVVRPRGGWFTLLDKDRLAPITTIDAGAIPLPYTFGPGRQIRFTLTLAESAASEVPLAVLTADPADFPLFAREERTSFSVVDETQVVVSDGNVVFTAEKKIYGIVPSPDGHKVIVYLGSTDYILFNTVTRQVSTLPTQIEKWSWLPDNSTLLGQITEGVSSGIEEIARTHLYLYETGGEPVRIELPSILENARLRVLDISAEGYVLVDADQVEPQPVYLGIMAFRIAGDER